jgi:peptide/nickel transport system permease protein
MAVETNQLGSSLVQEDPRAVKYYSASQFQLMWWRFRKNRIAVVGTAVYFFFIFIAIFAEFVSPTTKQFRDTSYTYGPPQKVHFVDDQGKFHLRPFVYGIKSTLNQETFEWEIIEDKSERLPIRFFVEGETYEFWGLFKSDIHLFGISDGILHLWGTDDLGRDVLSRTIYATRISLSIGIFGILTSFIIGLTIGGAAGYFGGRVDNILQRFIEFMVSLPQYPIWMSLAAAVPKEWPPMRIYILITIMIGFFSWTGLARRLRGLVLSIRNEDYAVSAKISGCSDQYIILRHMLPTCLSYIIVDLTVSFPGMILGETALSFLGLGLQAPVVSWGVLLNKVSQLETIVMYPWFLYPAIPLVLAMLAVNLIGDGLRDAADPYSR